MDITKISADVYDGNGHCIRRSVPVWEALELCRTGEQPDETPVAVWPIYVYLYAGNDATPVEVIVAPTPTTLVGVPLRNRRLKTTPPPTRNTAPQGDDTADPFGFRG
jgi:hypothetical protein